MDNDFIYLDSCLGCMHVFPCQNLHSPLHRVVGQDLYMSSFCTGHHLHMWRHKHRSFPKLPSYHLLQVK